MASTTQDKLFEIFVAISHDQASSQENMVDASEGLRNAIAQIGQAIQPPSATSGDRGSAGPSIASAVPAPVPVPVWSSTQGIQDAAIAPAATTAGATGSLQSITSTVLSTVFGAVPLAGALQNATSGGGSGGILNTVESVASTVLKSGLGLLPIVGGILGLFGGGGPPEPPPLVKYAMPASIDFRGAETAAGLSNVDYDQQGLPRAYSSGANSAASGPGPSQVTVNVQAMDARSFLDRSSDIAAAVRDAMLNLNSINDVVNDL